MCRLHSPCFKADFCGEQQQMGEHSVGMGTHNCPPMELGPTQGQSQAPQSLDCNWGKCELMCHGPDQLDLSRTLMSLG